jgi:two-component system response regulator YesN
VDDELPVRHFLRSLIQWERHGFAICAEANNGVQALEFVRQYEPDIVILDIHMPGMDGAALSGQIGQSFPEVRMIVLSSFDNYEYVRETMRNGAIDYLLKHSLDAPALLAALKTARDRQLAETQKRREFESSLERWQKASPTLIPNEVREWVLGDAGKLPVIADHFANELAARDACSYMSVVMQVANFLVVTERFSDAERHGYIRTVADLCRQCVGDRNNGVVAHIDQGKFILLLIFRDRSEHAVYSRLDEMMGSIKRLLRVYLDVYGLFGRGPLRSSLSDIPASYETACVRIEKMVTGDGSRTEDTIFIANEDNPVSLSLQQENELLLALDMRDRERTDRLLKGIFADLKACQASSYSIQIVMNELIHLANKVWRKTAASDGPYFDGEYLSREQLGHYIHLDEILAWTIKLYGQLIDKLQHRLPEKKYSAYVTKAIQYMNHHFRETISLEQTAEQIGISVSYLSRLFKEETGQTFTERLNEVRIHRSKRLIDSGDNKIKDIYERVGFSSYNYFFKVFKDFEGMTPQDYAKSRKAERKQ